MEMKKIGDLMEINSLCDHWDDRIRVFTIINGKLESMLSYFFAGINARNSYEKMKLYFIDDLTACMDDVNMLAFMDLLKYQMTSKATMEQLFFITCDDRIGPMSILWTQKVEGFSP